MVRLTLTVRRLDSRLCLEQQRIAIRQGGTFGNGSVGLRAVRDCASWLIQHQRDGRATIGCGYLRAVGCGQGEL